MLRFPKQVRIKFSIKYRVGLYPNLKFILFAARKNNYTIPLLSDLSGEARLSVDHVRRSISDDWELFPMDYVSALEECSPEVEIRVCSSEDVQRSIKAMKMFKPASAIPDGLIEGFQNSVNAHYLPTSTRFDIEKTNSLEVGVVPSAR